MYKKFYRLGQILINLLLYTNKDFKKNLAIIIEKGNFTHIHDIGGSDGILLEYVNLNKKKYFCYDIDRHNLSKARKKYKKKKNIKFIYKSIDKIRIKNNKKCLVVLDGVIHHVNDKLIQKFLEINSTQLRIIARDGFYYNEQNLFSKMLLNLDKGKYVRDFLHYKKILKDFRFKKRLNYYLRFHSYLISYKNINKELIKIL